MDYEYTIEDKPTQADINALQQGLINFNLRHIPGLREQPQGDVAVVARDINGTIIGGAYGEIGWGWLFVDILWVHASQRGTGLGTRILNTIEQTAVQRGIDKVYLYTTSFQARPFYIKQGYEQWGALPDYPPGHTYFFMRKNPIPNNPGLIDPTLDIIDDPGTDVERALDAGLRGHINEHAPLDERILAIFVRETGAERGSGQVMGGVLAVTYWTWCELDFMWLDERLRGQGWDTRLFGLLEDECARRGSFHFRTDTADFQGLGFYQKLGFEIEGTLPARPPGHTSYFIRRQKR